MLEKAVFNKWRKETEKEELSDDIAALKKAEEDLLNIIPKNYKKLVTYYALALVDKTEFLHYNLKIKIFSLRILIGIELQNIFVFD